MIRYNSKEWFRNMYNLARSWTMYRLLRFCLLTGVLTAIICVGVIEFLPFHLDFDPTIFSLVGIVLSILLVFRTNTAYDRWWEGRKQWGALVNHCRSFALVAESIHPKEETETRLFYARHISNFCISLKEHLREGTKLEELDLTAEELAILKQKNHVPNQISSWLYNKMQTVYRSSERMSDSDHLNMKTHQQALIDILGACERIRKTPIPFSYNAHIKTFILLYCAILPFGLVGMFGYFAVPLGMIITFALLGVEMIGEEIENPFSLDCNALPTGTLANTIKGNVYEILEGHTPEGIIQPEIPYEKVF